MAVIAAPAIWQGELTPADAGGFPKLAPSSLDFEITWNGMVRSGQIHIEFFPRDVKKSGARVVRSSCSSSGPAAALFSYHANFWSEINATTLRPRFFQAVGTDEDETVTTTVRHGAGVVVSQETTRNLATGAVETKDREFRFTPVFDLFSAMLHVRARKLDDGERIVMVVQPFDTPYLLRIHVAGREIHDGRKTIRLTAGLAKIDRATLELKPYKKLKRDATLWLSDDTDRIPVEFRADAFIGDVRAVLTAQRKL